MSKDKNATEAEAQEQEVPLDIQFKTQKAATLYREIKKKETEEEVKRTIINFLSDHRKQLKEEFESKATILS